MFLYLREMWDFTQCNYPSSSRPFAYPIYPFLLYPISNQQNLHSHLFIFTSFLLLPHFIYFIYLTFFFFRPILCFSHPFTFFYPVCFLGYLLFCFCFYLFSSSTACAPVFIHLTGRYPEYLRCWKWLLCVYIYIYPHTVILDAVFSYIHVPLWRADEYFYRTYRDYLRAFRPLDAKLSRIVSYFFIQFFFFQIYSTIIIILSYCLSVLPFVSHLFIYFFNFGP